MARVSFFIGSADAQAGEKDFGWPDLTIVTNMASARRAIEKIVTEGEGARGDWKKSHFGRFLDMMNEYRGAELSDPDFVPSRPVLAAFVRPPGDAEKVELIEDEFTGAVSDLFNAS